jgi:hypothetical protein
MLSNFIRKTMLKEGKNKSQNKKKRYTMCSLGKEHP